MNETTCGITGGGLAAAFAESLALTDVISNLRILRSQLGLRLPVAGAHMTHSSWLVAASGGGPT
jgi:hypothetical protein